MRNHKREWNLWPPRPVEYKLPITLLLRRHHWGALPVGDVVFQLHQAQPLCQLWEPFANNPDGLCLGVEALQVRLLAAVLLADFAQRRLDEALQGLEHRE